MQQQLSSHAAATRISRGPRRLEYLPPQFHGINGIEHVTTASQLRRLEAFLDVPAEKRDPFLRLGCSVKHRKGDTPGLSSAVYAVHYDGKVEVLYRRADPRTVHKWMSNPARAWQLAKSYKGSSCTDGSVEEIGALRGDVQEPRFYVATIDPDTAPGIVDEQGNTCCGIRPDGESVLAVHARRHKEGGSLGTVELLVYAPPDWWLETKLAEMFFAVREVVGGEVFAAKTGPSTRPPQPSSGSRTTRGPICSSPGTTG